MRCVVGVGVTSFIKRVMPGTVFNPYNFTFFFMGHRHSADPNQTSSDQGLHCLITECSIKSLTIIENLTQQP